MHEDVGGGGKPQTQLVGPERRRREPIGEEIELVSSAKTQLCAGGRKGVFVMQPAKDRIGTDGIRFSATIARIWTWVDEGAA
jgi:hypothetical protein